MLCKQSNCVCLAAGQRVSLKCMIEERAAHLDDARLHGLVCLAVPNDGVNVPVQAVIHLVLWQAGASSGVYNHSSKELERLGALRREAQGRERWQRRKVNVLTFASAISGDMTTAKAAGSKSGGS